VIDTTSRTADRKLVKNLKYTKMGLAIVATFLGAPSVIGTVDAIS